MLWKKKLPDFANWKRVAFYFIWNHFWQELFVARFRNHFLQSVRKPRGFCVLLLVERRWKKQFNRVLQYCPVHSDASSSASQNTSAVTRMWVNFHSLLIFFSSFSIRFKFKLDRLFTAFQYLWAWTQGVSYFISEKSSWTGSCLPAGRNSASPPWYRLFLYLQTRPVKRSEQNAI